MQSFIPDPLHPAVVHLPVALAVLVPLFAVGALVFIGKGARPRAAWGVMVGLLAMLLLSGWVSLKTGEQQEERVEDVVGESSIHGHEEAAEAFLFTTAAVLAVGLVGLAGGRVGQVGRWAATVGTVAILGAGWNVGHTGGMLVYRDGAASAYATGSGGGGTAGERGGETSGERQRGERRGDDDDDGGR